MNLRKIITGWFARRRQKIAAQRAERLERKRAVIRAQIARRREKREAWRPLTGSLKDATTAALQAENEMAAMNGLLEG